MTLHPPLSIQGAGDVENAVDWRHYIYAVAQAFGGPGVIGATSLQCTVNNGTSATPTTDVLAGPAFVAGTAAHQGDYFVYSDATFTVTHATRDASHPRIDTIIAHVRDNDADPGDAGGNRDWVIVAVAGTPATSPIPPSSLPDDCLVLGNVTVPTGTTTTTIDDSVRVRLPKTMGLSGNLNVAGNAAVTGTLAAGPSQLDGVLITGTKVLHAGLTPATEYAVDQNGSGATTVNSKGGQVVTIAEGNTPVLTAALTGGVSDVQMVAGLPEHTGTSELFVVFHSGDGQLRKVTSSRRYKHDEIPLLSEHDAERIVRNIAPKTFVLNADETETRRAGFIAEDVAVHFPQGAVYAEVDGEIVPEALDTTALLAATWGALQSAFAKIDRLEEQVSALKR